MSKRSKKRKKKTVLAELPASVNFHFEAKPENFYTTPDGRRFWRNSRGGGCDMEIHGAVTVDEVGVHFAGGYADLVPPKR